MKGVPALAKIILILLFVNVIDGAINHTNTNTYNLPYIGAELHTKFKAILVQWFVLDCGTKVDLGININ